MYNTISFDRVANVYDATRSFPPKTMDKIVHSMKQFLLDNNCNKILDGGCGTGRYLVPLSKEGFDVTGVDVSLQMMARCKQKLYHSKTARTGLVLGDVRALPFEDDVFDAVTSNHVLHLINNWKLAIRDYCRVSKPSAYFITIAAEKSSHRDFREEYDRICRDNKFAVRHPGKREPGLKKNILPYKREFICVYVEKIDADLFIDEIENRLYSKQWSVPDSIHKKAVSELRKKYSGQEFINRQELVMLVWRLRDLKNIL